MEYNFGEIERKWQQAWKQNGAYKVSNNSSKPKYYVLDMFPYPSGAGLHVGHPLGYIASDIFARFKRLKGFNVLHPMGYDAFGLPAEQYAIEHGIHPAVSTENNINNFRKQLDHIGFCYDWDREVRTCEPGYYKWTQWIFLQLFHSWFNRQTQKAENIQLLIQKLETEGSDAAGVAPLAFSFTADEWKTFSHKQQQDILMEYRLAYCGYGEVNWCEALGTVLANDEVVNGVSERGGHPVVKKKLRQWYLRITEYADRLLEGLQRVDFSDAMKEMQTNWIGKSTGAEIEFPLSISPRRGEGTDMPSPGGQKIPGFGYVEYKVGDPLQYEFAKQMRKEPTEAEKLLWDVLQNRKTGFKFRRQHPVDKYIADFICLDVWLIVEADGNYHNTAEQQEADKERDRYLQELGFTILRFTNEEILLNTDAVLNTITETATNLKTQSVNSLREQQHNPSPLQGEARVRVYTTRPDTIFGVDFMVVAPEHDLIQWITSPEQKAAVGKYIEYVKSRSERERQAEKKISGCFTGAYAINPFNGAEIPIWISEYVLAGYGTGAIMAVPCGDDRDFKFAKHFNIPITNILGDAFNGEEANATKDAVLTNSGFLNGIVMRDAIAIVNNKLEELGIGKAKINYRMRDAAFSRQRYWGEPFPIVWKEGIAYPLDEKELPLLLPETDEIKPGKDGEGPLTNLTEWINSSPIGGGREGATMPGYAGSSWYFLRYMDPHNSEVFADRTATDYWNQVDVYIGGTEHAVGHLLYSRLWTKVLFDLGHIGFDEPFKRLVNQGMITGVSKVLWRRKYDAELASNKEMIESISLDSYDGLDIKSRFIFARFYSLELVNRYGKDHFVPLNVPIQLVDGEQINPNELIATWPDRFDGVYITEIGYFFKGKWYKKEGTDIFFETTEFQKFTVESVGEKMSKSKFNTESPDNIVEKYGADTFRMYEMFLGPVEQSKPWDTKGIEGVHRFLRKLWRLFFDELKGKIWNNEIPTDAELKVLHKAIKKIEDDTERFSFNTAVSAFMVCVNELSELKCNKRSVLEPLLVLLTPYAPHVAEELWQSLGNTGSILDAAYPVLEEKYLVESAKEYPVSINGKLRTTIHIALDADAAQVEAIVLANEVIKKWLEDKPVKKFIFVKGKMVNVVI